MTLLRWPFRLVIGLLALTFSHKAADAGLARPNVIVILADDLGYADLGCCGGKEVLTPNLDRLAKEGIRGTSFYVTWPACTPSRGSLLTGRYPQRNGLYDMIRNDMVNYGHAFTEEEYAFSPEMTLGLDLREVTIAAALKKAGYVNGIVGKWDSGRARRFLPLQRGFDFFYGFANTGIDYYTHERYGIASMFRGNERTTEDKGSYATEVFQREAVKFIRDHARQPFFLYCAFNAPHSASNLEKDQWQVPEKYLKRYPTLPPKANRTRYMAMVSCLDDAVGELMGTLQELKISQDTLMLFYSDNGGSGPGDNHPLRGGKSGMMEGGLRVPFIARWPGRIPAGKITDEFLTSLEIFPTLLAAAQTPVPTGVTLDGFDMLPVLAGATKSPRQEMFWQRRSDKAARVNLWKWFESAKGTGLYDLANDPGEKDDLSAQKPEVLARVKARFTTWQKAMETAEPRGPFRDY